ncbi:MAG: ComC/BlpC family leader-containing pheromone/bacteriocin [Eubacteriales bacterium]|nr:ComC/BlpC family leader-containing pheromone/bacteriocin [Eubacteriales bacterium]
MSKSKEELNELKKEVEAVSEKLQELTEEELEQVTGGSGGLVQPGVSLSPPTSEELSSNKS